MNIIKLILKWLKRFNDWGNDYEQPNNFYNRFFL